MPIVRTSQRRLHAALVSLVLLGSADSILAQSTAAPDLVPPRLVENVDPEYPVEEKARAGAATVVLLLEIDEAGHVARVTVTTSGGPHFDAAALQAAERLSFAPATRSGRAIRAKIPFQFTFRDPRAARFLSGELLAGIRPADGRNHRPRFSSAAQRSLRRPRPVRSPRRKATRRRSARALHAVSRRRAALVGRCLAMSAMSTIAKTRKP